MLRPLTLARRRCFSDVVKNQIQQEQLEQEKLRTKELQQAHAVNKKLRANAVAQLEKAKKKPFSDLVKSHPWSELLR